MNKIDKVRVKINKFFRKNKLRLKLYINRIRRKKKLGYRELMALIIGILVLTLIIVLIIVGIRSCARKADEKQSENIAVDTPLSIDDIEETTESPEEIEARERKAYIDSLISGYKNIAIASIEGSDFLYVREEPDINAHMVGKLYDGAVCDILEDAGTDDDLDWKRITSGDITGYASGKYLITGEEAKSMAPDLVKTRATITADRLFVRDEPSTQAYVVTNVSKGEVYEIYDEKDGWFKISEGWISSDYAVKEDGLSVAVKPSEKELVVNQYENLGVSVAESYVNIRKNASKNSEIIGKFPRHAGAEIIGEDGDWYKIKSGSLTGYVSKEYITTGASARQLAKDSAELMAIVSTSDGSLNVRSGPGTDYDVWTTISNNERYVVLDQTDGWVELELEDDNNAFASADYLKVQYALAEAVHFSPAEEANMLRNQIVNYAMKFLGNPYVWGGTSLTHGCDCSGFTQGIMKNFGIKLPRVSGDQSHSGVAVSASELRAGDLVFYTNSAGTINHVAMYIGNGQVIHAASKKSGIKISSWKYRTPKCMRNVVGN